MRVCVRACVLSFFSLLFLHQFLKIIAHISYMDLVLANLSGAVSACLPVVRH